MPHPEQFVPDTQENITAYLAHDLCLGVFDGERLGAYFILRYCGQSEHNYAAFLGHPAGRVGPLGQCRQRRRPPGLAGATACSGSCWKPPCPLLRPGIVGIGATVSPENQYSLNNALACGFTIATRREMYGGYDRYLLEKRI